jgi:hypothetical protein
VIAGDAHDAWCKQKNRVAKTLRLAIDGVDTSGDKVDDALGFLRIQALQMASSKQLGQSTTTSGDQLPKGDSMAP